MVIETTCSVAVGTGPDVKLGLLPFTARGKRGKRKTPKAEGAMWKELTVPVSPWKKPKNLSAYQAANAYMGSDAIEFAEGLLPEVVAVAAQRVINGLNKPTWEQETRAYDAMERVFEAWKVATVNHLAELAVNALNARMEVIVLEMHSITEGLEMDFVGRLAPAFKFESGEIWVNEAYLRFFSHVSQDLSEAVHWCFDLFEDNHETRFADLEEAVDKITQALTLNP